MTLNFPFVTMRQYGSWAIVFFAAIAAVAAFLQALDYPFVSDDMAYVVDNYKLANLSLSELWRLISEPYNPYEFLPLRDLSYWIDITLFGLNPSAYRLHNIVLYLFCLPLVYVTTMELWKYFRPAESSSASWVAAAVTALFVIHPAHVEPVVWISSRKDILSTMFSMFALWFSLKTKRKNGLSASYASATLIALLAAMMSKATAVAVAPIIAILWVFFWREISIQDRQRIQLLWPVSVLLLAIGVVLIFSINSAVKVTPYFGVEVITRALAVLGWLVRLVVSPESRHFIYPVFEGPYLPLMVTFGLAVLVSAFISLLMIVKKPTLEGFAVIAFVLLCIPYIQLIPYKTASLVSDRFLSIAVWPALLLIVSLSWRLKHMTRMILLLAIALVWIFQTAERTKDWRSYEALWEADYRDYPEHYLPAYEKITMYQLTKGKFREADQVANKISFPEARNIMKKIVEVAKGMKDISSTGDPLEVMDYLHDLEQLLIHPPEQVKWDPTLEYFWTESMSSFVLVWQDLVKRFPDYPQVRLNARKSLMNALKYGDASTQ